MSAAPGRLVNTRTPAEEAGDEIDSALAAFEQRRAELLEALERVFVTDEDSTARASEYLSQLKTLRERVQRRRGEIAEPYDTAATLTGARAGRWLSGIFAAEDRVRELIDAYRVAERKRIADAQEEQQRVTEAALAARRGPSAPPPPPRPPSQPIKAPSVKGDYGSSVSDQLEDVFTITDVRAIPDLILLSEPVLTAIRAQCKVAKKLMREIPGVTITQQAKTVHRRK